MSQIASVRDLINLWPTRADLTDDIRSLASGVEVSVGRVHKWAETGTIPAKYQSAVLLAAQGRGFPVTADLIVRLHAPAALRQAEVRCAAQPEGDAA